MNGRSLRKSERLCGDKAIQRLFAEGRSAYAFPFRYYWLCGERAAGQEAVSVLFSVPKRSFKRAVKRNAVKRHAREAFRLNKESLTVPAAGKGLRVELALIYSPKELSDFKTIENGVKRILAEIAKGI